MKFIECLVSPLRKLIQFWEKDPGDIEPPSKHNACAHAPEVSGGIPAKCLAYLCLGTQRSGTQPLKWEVFIQRP